MKPMPMPERKDNTPIFSISYVGENYFGDKVIYAIQAWYLPYGNSLVQVWHKGYMHWFEYPSYKIWNVANHIPEIIESFVERFGSEAVE